jgi:hypothetical protein
MKLARTASPRAIQRLIELAELDRVDERGHLAPLSDKADPRIVTVAANALIERAWGKPKEYDPAEDKKKEKPAFNPADFSHEELFQIEAALRLMVTRREEKARALADT